MEVFFVEGAVSLAEVKKVRENYSKESLKAMSSEVVVVDVRSFDDGTYKRIASNLLSPLDFLRYKGSRIDDKEEVIKVVNGDTREYFYIKCGDSKYPKSVGFELK